MISPLWLALVGKVTMIKSTLYIIIYLALNYKLGMQYMSKEVGVIATMLLVAIYRLTLSLAGDNL